MWNWNSLKRWSGVGAGLLIGSLALAQAPPSQAPNSTQTGTDPAPALIQGYVVRTGSGEPLAKAQVMLRPEQGRSQAYGAVTDAGGRFVLANVAPGNYLLEVERDGYVDQEYGQVSPSRPGTVLVLSAGQQVQDVVIRLVPTGAITGRIYDQDGEPVVGASVRAMSFAYDDGERALRSVSQAQTNDLGEYRLYWLEPGEYRVSARFQPGTRQLRELIDAVIAADPAAGGPLGLVLPGGGGRGAVTADQVREALNGLADPSEEIYLDTYFPGAIDALTASAIHVHPGSEIGGIDFTVLPTRAVTVSGEVIGPLSEDAPINASVSIVSRNSVVVQGGGGRGSRRGGGRGRDGSFRLTGVAPGSYTVVATVRSGGFGGRGGRGGGGTEMTGFADVEVGNQDIEGLRIAVQPGVTLQGQVLVDQSANDLDVSRLEVRLEPLHNLPIGAPDGDVEEDGTFVIQNVSPTMHRVVLRGLPVDAYLAAARVGSQDVLEEGLYPNANTGPIQFYVSGMGTVLEGTVRLEPQQPFTGAQVVLIPENPERSDLYKVSTVDQYGRFTMRGIAPGRYRVFAWEDAPAGAYEDPGFVGLYRDYGEPIQVEQGAAVQAQPRLIPAGL